MQSHADTNTIQHTDQASSSYKCAARRNPLLSRTMWPLSANRPRTHLHLVFTSPSDIAANNLSQVCAVSSPAADPSKLLILPRTHTCPPTDINTCSYTHIDIHTHTHTCAKASQCAQVNTRRFYLSLPYFYSAVLKHGVRASSAMPHRGNEKNKIYFFTAWLFHRMTLNSVMAMKGERESRDREREREMHVI